MELFVYMSVAMTTTSITIRRGLSEGPQGLLQAADIVVDEALLAKILGTSDAHKREHSINFFEIENLQCKRGSKGQWFVRETKGHIRNISGWAQLRTIPLLSRMTLALSVS